MNESIRTPPHERRRLPRCAGLQAPTTGLKHRPHWPDTLRDHIRRLSRCDQGTLRDHIRRPSHCDHHAAAHRPRAEVAGDVRWLGSEESAPAAHRPQRELARDARRLGSEESTPQRALCPGQVQWQRRSRRPARTYRDAPRARPRRLGRRDECVTPPRTAEPPVGDRKNSTRPVRRAARATPPSYHTALTPPCGASAHRP